MTARRTTSTPSLSTPRAGSVGFSRRLAETARAWGGRSVAGLALLASALVVVTSTLAACPFCAAPMLTFSEQMAKSDAAVLVQWVSAVQPEKDSIGSTTYSIVEVAVAPGTRPAPATEAPPAEGDAEPPAPKVKLAKPLAKGQKITIERYREGKAGDLSLLLGSITGTGGVEWGNPLEVTEGLYQYMRQAPSPETASTTRLTYFLKFLESADPQIAGDAYQEFANAPYKDITQIADKMPREKLKKWVADPKTSAGRLGLYGLMLGLCGKPEDAAIMEARIVEKSDDYRLGIDGVMGGYLLLKGEAGLELIEKTKIEDTKVPFSETYAARQAVLFLNSYGAGSIPLDRLKKSLRVLLEKRPEMADLTIADLARMKDWSIRERLLELYGAEGFDVPAVKRSIVRFLIACTKDLPAGGGEKVPEHVTQAKEQLETLRKRDPKLVAEAEKFFFLQ